MFHLKRFELNFDTFRREKVNDAFPFPKFLNMYPYTKEGLTGHGQGLGSGPGVGSGSGSGKEGCCRWLEFNDSEVTEFSESRLDAECFGGTTISHDFHKDTKVGHK